MDKKQLETLGYYEPGFLHLRINTDHELKDLNQLAADPTTTRYFSTFLHEYIHFLQNVTTTYGLCSTIFLIDFIKAINYEVINDGKQEFKTPFEITNKYNIEANLQLKTIYTGGMDNIPYIKYENYIVENGSVTDNTGRTVEPVRYKVYYYTKTGQLKSFYFGSACLTEYVAHAIQSKFDPNISHPDVPYVAPELIIEKEYSEFGSDPMHIAALCDACMMSYHPAQQFFGTIARMKLEKFIPKTAAEIYEYVFAGTKFKDQNREISVIELFESTSDLALNQLNNALQSEIFTPNREWLNHIFSEARSLRLNQPDFIVSLVENAGRLSEIFYRTFHQLGTPFFTNKAGTGGFVPPRQVDAEGIQPYQLLVFKEIINIFMGKKKCGLYSFCKSHSKKEIINDDCLNAPWKRGMGDDLCPFGQFWKTWGLNGSFPVS